MSHPSRPLVYFCAFTLSLCAIAAPCLAGDDSTRFVGTWQTRLPVNGLTHDMICVNTASDTQVFVATPNGKALVKRATFTAKDGQYQENATLGTSASCQYQFIDDNHLQMSNALGAVVWVRSPQAAVPTASPGAPGAPAATPAAAPPAPTAPAPSAASPTPLPAGGSTVNVPQGAKLHVVSTELVLPSQVTPDHLYHLRLSRDVGQSPIALPSGADVVVHITPQADAAGRTAYVITADHVTVRGADVPFVAASRPMRESNDSPILHPNVTISLTVSQPFDVPAPPAPAPTPAVASAATPTPTGGADAPASTAVPSEAAPTGKPNIPWTTPAQAADYAVDGTDLWDIATHTLVAKDWDEHGASRLVLDRPDLMLCGDQTPDRNGFATISLHLSSPGTPLVTGPGDLGSGLHPMVSSDLRRVVWIDKGDVWRGEFDWIHSTIINHKQVTNLGVFSSQPIYWCDNYLFFSNASNQAKPTIRVDLLSGDFIQFAGRDFFDGMVAPNGNLLGKGRDANGRHNNTWVVLNPRSLKIGSLPAGINVGVPRIPNEASFRNAWLDGDNVLFTDPHHLLSMNFTTGVATPVAVFNPRSSLLNQLLPGGQAVEIIHVLGAAHAMTHSQVRVVLSLKNGKETPMNYGADDYGIWIDGDHFIYGQPRGDLTTPGMYLFTASTGTTTRLCQRPGDLSPAPAFFPQLNTLVFHSSSGGGTFCSVKLDGRDLTPLDMKSIRPINADPADLGLGSSSKPTWQPIQYTAEQLAVPNG